jgi:hypothetical protein
MEISDRRTDKAIWRDCFCSATCKPIVLVLDLHNLAYPISCRSNEWVETNWLMTECKYWDRIHIACNANQLYNGKAKEILLGDQWLFVPVWFESSSIHLQYPVLQGFKLKKSTLEWPPLTSRMRKKELCWKSKIWASLPNYCQECMWCQSNFIWSFSPLHVMGCSSDLSFLWTNPTNIFGVNKIDTIN